MYQRMLAEMGARIARLQAEFREWNRDEPGMLRLPFRCCLCEKFSSQFAMMTGDGLPACAGCLGGAMRAINA